MSVDSRESQSATYQEDTAVDPTGLKSDRAEVEPGTYSLSVSTEPETDQKQKKLLTNQAAYPKYATKVGAGGTAKDPFAYDPTVSKNQEINRSVIYQVTTVEVSVEFSTQVRTIQMSRCQEFHEIETLNTVGVS